MQTTIANLQFNTIKEKLEAVYKSSNLIHVSIHNKRNKILDAPSKIIGIYPRFLCVEAKVNTYVEKFTINFVDIMTGNITIKEL
ncbi:MAG: hypothetical protein NC087_09935 [Anaeroplasma bactoclasticum]|nr:hypothetical protein [Anaeroplasma bactoclasticum]MCM1557826.1 hypothetical protein [Anaeroplasma bactoclasticum]